MLEKMTGWLEDRDTFIGVFENKAMDNGNFGRKAAFPFPLDQWGIAIVGRTHAPDLKDDPGWKYILVHKTTDAQDALSWMLEDTGE